MDHEPVEINPVKFQFHDGDLNHTVVVAEPGAGMSVVNPLLPMKDEADFLLAMLVQLAGGDVDEAAQGKAKEVMNSMGEDHDELTMLDLIGVFDSVPELQVFASKLRSAALIGQYGKLFSSPDVAGMPVAFDEYHKLGPDPAVAKSHELYQEFCAAREARNKSA